MTESKKRCSRYPEAGDACYQHSKNEIDYLQQSINTYPMSSEKKNRVPDGEKVVEALIEGDKKKALSLLKQGAILDMADVSELDSEELEFVLPYLIDLRKPENLRTLDYEIHANFAEEAFASGKKWMLDRLIETVWPARTFLDGLYLHEGGTDLDIIGFLLERTSMKDRYEFFFRHAEDSDEVSEESTIGFMLRSGLLKTDEIPEFVDRSNMSSLKRDRLANAVAIGDTEEAIQIITESEYIVLKCLLTKI